MNLTQFLIFEITPTCNLAREHANECPVALPDRYGTLDTSRPLTDDAIVEMAHMAYQDLQFGGLIGWHYYNEPMLAWPRLRRLMDRIKQEIPVADFVLWTNGTLFPEAGEDLSPFRAFSQIWVSNYQHKDWSHLQEGLPEVEVHICGVNMDDRTADKTEFSRKRCLRPFNELIIDHYGNGHLCCMDFRGRCNLGNVWTEGFRAVVERFLSARNMICQEPMPKQSPAICQGCRFRADGIGKLIGPIADKASRYVSCLPRSKTKARLLIGATSGWQMSDRRRMCLETWASTIKSMGLEFAFLMAVPTIARPERSGHMVCLPCPDNHETLPQRTRWFCQWALSIDGWEYLFKCDDDTLIHAERMATFDQQGRDYIGAEWKEGVDYASGGAGYFLSRKAAEIVAERLTEVTGDEDVLVGRVLREVGIPMHKDNRFVPFGSEDRRPSSTNDLITSHALPPKWWSK